MSGLPDRVWTVEYTVDGLMQEDDLRDLQVRIDDDGIDGSVAAIPHLGQWTLSFGVDAEKPHDILNEGALLLDKLAMHVDPVAVKIYSPREYERMAHEPTMPVLVGASEVSEILGVSRQRVHQLQRRADFPAVLVDVAMGPLWDERAVRAFERRWDRTPGRPRRHYLGQPAGAMSEHSA